MIWHQGHGLKWLSYELFSDCPKIIHATFTRHGGVSPAPYDSLNLAIGIGDEDSNVKENQRRICETLGLSELVTTRHVHQTDLIPLPPVPKVMPEADGFLIEAPGIGAMVKHADCQAAIFYDPLCHIGAVVHAGWRGSVQNIYQFTIDQLQAVHQCRPENLLIAISPSLGPASAEFRNYKEELPESFWEYQVQPNYFDFWEISHAQLLKAGVLPHHIEIAGVDTVPDRENFFSYRRDKTTGRNGTVLALL